MRSATPRLGPARYALLAQGWVYIVTGLWPVVHLGSFERVTGEKFDDFLVHTVGLLLAVVGVVLLRALARQRLTVEIAALAAGAAASLAVIDGVYWLNGRLPSIYLLDAAMEVAFLLAAIAAAQRLRHAESHAT